VDKITHAKNGNSNKYSECFGTMSIDISCPVNMLEKSKKLYYKYKPLEHTGKFMISKCTIKCNEN